MKLSLLIGSIATATAALVSMAQAHAQTYPTRPVTLIVGYAPGGATDTLARTVADKLQARLGQPVLVENKPGASTTIATNYVRAAAPDGHTIYVVTSQFGQMPIVNPSIAKYDPIKDFVSIGPATNMLMVMVANPKAPYNNMKELVEYAKANPGKINVATTGIGSTDHLGGELLSFKTGTKYNFVPYKGGLPAVQDVMAGVADIRLDAMASSRQFIEAGKLKALATFDPQRHPGFPNIPAITETVQGIDWSGFIGVVGPKGMPPAIVSRLSKEIAEILKLPDVVAKLNTLGLDPVSGTAEQFTNILQKDYDQWSKLIKDTNMKIE